MFVLRNFGVMRSALFTLLFLTLVRLPTFCQHTSLTTVTATVPTESVMDGDFIEFDYDQDIVIDNYNLSIQYLCSKPCTIVVEVVASSEFRTGVVIYRTRWKNEKHLHVTRNRTVLLKFPDIMVYREDFFIKHTISIRSVVLRAWIVDSHHHNEHNGYVDSFAQAKVNTFKVLKALPPFQRPFKNHTKCLQWDAEQIWRLTENRIPHCPHESDTVDMLNFPHASTGERFGIIRKLDRFINKDFEKIRVQRVHNPRFTFSVWIYLLSLCNSQICGILQHVSENNLYHTPLILLTNNGEIIIQVHLASGQDSAFKSFTGLSLKMWYRLDVSLEGTKVTLNVTAWKSIKETVENKHTYIFDSAIHYNDTSGYFVIGGSRFLPSIQGFFGPVKYYRLEANGFESVVNPLFPQKMLEELDQKYQMCDNISEIIPVFLQILKQSRDITNKGTCHSYFSYLNNKFGQLPVCDKLPWNLETWKNHHTLISLMQTTEWNLSSGFWDMDVTKKFGRHVYEMVLERLTQQGGLGLVRSLMPYLQISSCCGYHKASTFLAIIHEAGLGLPVDLVQGHLYSLIAAQGDERMALMHLGYKHMQGIDGYPQDYDLSYSYYANIGKMTSVDRWEVQESEQYTTEYILLSDEMALKSQTNEEDDIFHYLNFQAQRGDLEAQRNLARMLFWGQHGVSKDIETAVKWYTKSALKLKDAQSMYDLSVVLIKGHGVKKNKTLGLQMMRKAASMGCVEAINGLGWYYSTFKADMVTAVKYFEKAAEKGSRDALYNLGVFHLNGYHPRNPSKNESAAFQHFLKASLLGHVDAIVETSHYYATGNLDNFTRNPETAVRFLKNICEQNGYLGYIIRRGLNAYLKGSWEEAFLNYLIAAETGMEVAQTNTAHICEENTELVHSLFSTYDCEWRYYNHSTLHYFGSTLGFLKMGDYYYYGHKNQSRDIPLSSSMYAYAALADSSQGIFNLAGLIEEGHTVSKDILEKLQIDEDEQLGKTFTLEQLYKRCRDLDREVLLSPCSLALFRIQMKTTWKKIMNNTALFSLTWLTFSVITATFITFLVQHIECERATDGIAQQYVNTSFRSNTNENITHPAEYTVSPAIPVRHNSTCWLRLLKSRVNHLVCSLLKLLRSQHVEEWAFTLLGVCLCILCVVIVMHLL
nr:PREDICTED: protein sel-1 homolog 3 isoform X1 [Lepisosteus oculatus]